MRVRHKNAPLCKGEQGDVFSFLVFSLSAGAVAGGAIAAAAAGFAVTHGNERADQRRSDGGEQQNIERTHAITSQQVSGDDKHHAGGDPRDNALRDNDADRFNGGAQLSPDGGDRRYAGCIQQGERQEAECGRGGEQTAERGAEFGIADTEQDAERADDRLLGGKAGHQRGRRPPIAEADGRKQRRDQPPEQGKQTVRTVGDEIETAVKAL